MRVKYKDAFNKQLLNSRDIKLAITIIKAIQIVKQTTAPDQIPNLKKLKGHKTAYRIKIGSYRIGLFIENDEVVFAAIAHRKDFYRGFRR